MEQSKTQIWHKFRHFIVGISVLLFGILIGGVGVASAGIGIGIPMIPLGIYLCVRGWHIFKQENNDQTDEDRKSVV